MKLETNKLFKYSLLIDTVIEKVILFGINIIINEFLKLNQK
jgi:hypothetical protein